MPRQTFKQWLYGQNHRHDAVGDLARDTIATEQLEHDPDYRRAYESSHHGRSVPAFPKRLTLQALNRSIHEWAGCSDALKAAQEAFEEWKACGGAQ